MTDFDFEPTPVPDHLDPSTIAGISDDVLESALVSYVVARWKELGGEAQALATMPSALRAWYVTFVVDGEVLNGGFNQLFFNASAGAGEDAPKAFETVGLPAGADLMRRARALLTDRGPALEDARREGTIEAFMDTYGDDPFGPLDAEYAEHEDEFRLGRIRFLRGHADAIRHP
jgi:uncharacterized protein DUF4375